MKPANSKVPAVRTVKVGKATLIVRASFFEALDIPDPIPPETRPLTLTPRQAQELIPASRSTIDRMIFAGRQAA
jgi:hypothetical protein